MTQKRIKKPHQSKTLRQIHETIHVVSHFVPNIVKSRMPLHYYDNSMSQHQNREIKSLNDDILNCTRCPRLAEYIRTVAKNRTKRFKTEKYHGKPLPGFGDVRARLLVVGLAPAAHGGNRTGRMFTGDSSADWLARAMFDHKFASIPTSMHASDGLILNDAYVTAAARCAPPQNKPTTTELRNCLPFLQSELNILNNVRLVLCLGQIAYKSACWALNIKMNKFGHNKLYRYNDINMNVLTSYHPSRQNTQTGRLTWERWNDIFVRARKLITQ